MHIKKQPQVPDMQIVLLRGLAREAAHWLEFPSLLQALLGDSAQVHLIDFPGCGEHHQQTALNSIAAMTDHARSELSTKLSPTEQAPLYVIGISMGGMVALDWAQRFPQEPSGIVLINSSAGNHPLWWRLKPAAWLPMLTALLVSSKDREARVLRLISNQPANYSQRLVQWRQIQRQRPINRSTIITMLRAAAGFRPKLTCTVAGLILASEGDRLVSVKASKTLAQQFNWPIQLHSSAGHDLPMDDPQWVAACLTQWLDLLG
jgi:pimeloyl-[acyl-carrier protein] methyl ester esterase